MRQKKKACRDGADLAREANEIMGRILGIIDGAIRTLDRRIADGRQRREMRRDR